MSGPVDVLAVMEQAIEDCVWLRCNSVKKMEITPEELVDARAAVAELIGTLRLSADALEKASACVDGGLAVLLADSATFARDALARVQGGEL